MPNVNINIVVQPMLPFETCGGPETRVHKINHISGYLEF